MNNGVRKKARHEPQLSQSCSESDSGSPPHVQSAAPPVSRKRIKRTASRSRGAKPSSIPGAQAESTMPARHNTGMSDRTSFRIYYGDGEVVNGPDGVDLSSFQFAENSLSRVTERTIECVMQWLYHIFRLDREKLELRLYCRASRVAKGYYWEMVEVRTTGMWRGYVTTALQKGWERVLLIFVSPRVVPFVGYAVESSSQGVPHISTTSKGEVAHASWIFNYEKGLVDILHDHKHVKFMGKNGWTTEGWKSIVKSFNKRFPLAKFTKMQIREKEKELKENYRAIHDARKKSGTGWNDSLCMIIAKPEIWNKLCKDIPKMKNFCSKSFPLFDSMEKLYEGSIATDDLNFTSTETVEPPPPSPNEHVNLNDPEVGVNPFSTNLDGQRASSDTIGVHKGDNCGEKRKQSQVAEVLQEHVDFRKKQTRIFVDEPDGKIKPKDDYSIKNCLVILESIEELSDEEKALAISIFKCSNHASPEERSVCYHMVLSSHDGKYVGESDHGLVRFAVGCPNLQKLELRSCCFSQPASCVTYTLQVCNSNSGNSRSAAYTEDSQKNRMPQTDFCVRSCFAYW
ncbi:hypothetical protein GUJ93_ZPchr0013g37677 [Zizania palustris]|uniref:Myb/SANT-like domain-containing protein n=1 Tax=Zizania palustris TaxID=103762 RepID=A0A8J5X0F9_ZIZPA|nr:hypothetical protein GUJ93_ZPchr0013g37677 [Zizania palustris]